MADKKTGTETPATFVSTFLDVVKALVTETLYTELSALGALLTVREGFPRGAAYTVHKSADKHANASAAIEPTTGGYDLILSNMVGARAEDAAGRLAVWFAVRIYPAVKADGKSKANHRTAERNALIKSFGLARSPAGWTWTAAAWEALRAFMPPTRYAGSNEPRNDRAMIAFTMADSDGNPLKRRCYLSLRRDGKDGDAEFVASLYARGIIAGAVTRGTPACYAPPEKPPVEEPKPQEKAA